MIRDHVVIVHQNKVMEQKVSPILFLNASRVTSGGSLKAARQSSNSLVPAIPAFPKSLQVKYHLTEQVIYLSAIYRIERNQEFKAVTKPSFLH